MAHLALQLEVGGRRMKEDDAAAGAGRCMDQDDSDFPVANDEVVVAGNDSVPSAQLGD